MSDTPTVTLAGQEWPVKPLVIMQLRSVVPAIMRLKDMTPTTITEDQYNDLIDIVYQSIASSQTPPLKKEDFMALPVTLLEMITSLDVITTQAGLTRKASDTGEAQAASQQTGTQS